MSGGKVAPDPPPRYDDVFFDGLAWLDELGASEECDAMSKVDEQDRFAGMVAELIQHIRAIGYKVTLGEVYRSPQEALRLLQAGIGAYPSYHTDRLAVDINLFLNGVYLQDGEDYACLGEWWESKGGSWGGRFSHPDSCHFSLGEGR